MYESAQSVRPEGALAERLARNLHRLSQTEEFSPAFVAEKDHYSWPGDYRGRLLLGLARHYEVNSQGEETFLAQIEDTLRVLAPTGFLLDNDADASRPNEQQLSGHSWMLRGLVCAYRLTRDERLLSAAKRLVHGLFIPSLQHLDAYAFERGEVNIEGQPIGEIACTAGEGWLYSTDIGCVFISLDGLTDYYDLTRDEALLPLLLKLEARFREIDVVGMGLQTHATLTTLRGLMRLYEIFGDADRLEFIRATFERYVRHGMTFNYANFNWFGKPLWTEPCAIVDSFMVALSLFKCGCDDRYADFAEKILYNALLASQRENGGFGLDNCTRPEEKNLVMLKGGYEAYWCCSMRGAEGLAFTALNCVLEDEGSAYVFTPLAGSYTLKKAVIDIAGDYPFSGNITLRVSAVSEPFTLKIGGQSFEITQASEGEPLNVAFDLTENEKDSARWRGPVMMGLNADGESVPLPKRFYRSFDKLSSDALQVIF